MKGTLAVPGITSDPAKDRFVTYGTMQNVVRERVGDVCLELYCGAGRKGVPPLPARGDR